jgi:hypothetical protein
MRKKLIAFILLVVILALVAPVSAVKYGQNDNNEHPYVGLIVFYDENDVPQWRCTGTLISPTLMVTAAHCTELEKGARVWFDDNVPFGDPNTQTGYPWNGGLTGYADASPWWQGGLFLPNTGDVGVVVLDAPVPHLPANYNFPDLAPAGFLDDLATRRGKQDVQFTVVGYGLQSVKPVYSSFRQRMWANVQLVNLSSALTDGYNLQTTNSPGKGHGSGGTCFGDSGGGIFNAENQIVAVNSFVMNANCAGASFGYRTDRQEVIDWINGPHPDQR